MPVATARAARSACIAVLSVLAAPACAAATPAAQAAPDAVALGREKYVQCAACHGADGRSTVIAQYPKIGGQSAAYVVIALKAYRDGRRLGTFAAVMSEVARPLTDADIANLAAYVESLDAQN